MARELYQTPYTEPLLIALPVATHIASGLAIRLIRRSQNLKRYGGATPGMHALHSAKTSASGSSRGGKAGPSAWPPLSYISVSGYAFGGLLVSHVAVTRIAPLIVDGDSSNIGLQYVSHGFTRHPLQAWVFYMLLLSVGVGHMVWGWAKWFNMAPPMNWRRTTVDRQLRKTRSRRWWGINGATLLVAGVWAAGALGIVARAGRAHGWLGTVYDTIYTYARQ